MLHSTVLAAVAGSALLFSRVLLETFNTPKLLLVVTAGFAVGGMLVTARIRQHGVVLDRNPAVLAGAIFLAFAAAAALGSPAPWRSLAGASNARAGFALYAACALLGLAAAMAQQRDVERLIRTLLVAAIPVVAYGLVQAAGADPLGWRVRSGGPPIFSTFGNANFLSAWLGIVGVLAVWCIASSGWSATWRWMSAATLVGLGVLGGTSGSIQGPIIAVAGSSAVAGAWLTDHGRHRARRHVARTIVALVLPVLVATSAAAMLLARGGAARSFSSRTGKWEAALAIARDRPLTGVGLDLFGDWYHAYRPVSDALSRGVSRTADAAHNVPLQLLSGGGVLLGLAYLAFVAVVGVIGLRGIRSAHGPRRMLVAAVGGAWLAYQLQSLVSMDVPPIAALHWVLSGMLLALAEPPRAPRFRRCAHRRWSVPAAVVASVAAAAVALSMSVPIRADVAARRAIMFAAQQRHQQAEESLRIAMALNPWDAAYPLTLGRLRARRGDPGQALQAYQVALQRQPRGMQQALEMPRMARRAGHHDAASSGYDYALRLDPRSPDLLREAARHHRRHGDPAIAEQLLRRASEPTR